MKAAAFDFMGLFGSVANMIAVDERRLKGLLKTAVTEVLEERQDLLRSAIRESLEDIALTRAIQLGEKSPLMSRKKSSKSSNE